MRALSELTHYEVLEVGMDADRDELERAYRLAQATYGEDSIATYSVYEESETEAIRERIELAWNTLTDDEQRRAYDSALAQPDDSDAIDLAIGLAPDEDVAASIDRVSTSMPRFDELEGQQGGPWDGPRLRRARLERGVEIDQIAKVTKINPTYLHCIEHDRFEELPARVYVRGFVRAYARCIGLDADRVVDSYTERLRPSESPRKRKRRGR